MTAYLRPRRTGARIFFTVALADRGSDLLVREVDRLRVVPGLDDLLGFVDGLRQRSVALAK